MKKSFLISIFFIIGLLAMSQTAIVLSPQARISLLTCTAGEELYSKFGHTAIRVCDIEQEVDWVFNYGMFDASVSHFYYRFVKGETDYQLGVDGYERFKRSYVSDGRAVFEQVLALDSVGKQRIFDALMQNYLPENRVYRYNFIYDNCATRPYYLIKDNMGVLYNTDFEGRRDTYRDIIAHYTGRNSWSFFGIDLIFGLDADHIMTAEERMFLPEELMDFFAGAQVYDNGVGHDVVSQSYIGHFIIPRLSVWQSPKPMLILLVFIVLLITLYQIWKKHYTFWLDAILYFILGLLGTIIAYLSFVSEHPMVHHNYNLLLVNPLFVILFILTCFRRGRQWLKGIQLPLLGYYIIGVIIRCVVSQPGHWLVWCVALVLIVRTWTCYRLHKGKMVFPIARRMMVFAILCCLSFRMHADKPRLLVHIVVNGLEERNLEILQNYFDKGGFRTLLQEGIEYKELLFPHLTTGGYETLATLYTGTVPANHGITADYYYSRADREVLEILEDEQEAGIGTECRISPRYLQAATYADMLRLQYGQSAKIYAIGIDAIATVISGGHTADGAVWIDKAGKGWATSTYYTNGLPIAADRMNADGTFMAIAAQEWIPRFPTSGLYLHPTERERQMNGFQYQAYNLRQDTQSYNGKLRQMPWANQLVADLALALQTEQQLGNDLIPDLLSLQFTTCTPAAKSDIIHSAEQEDMYIKLNETLGVLLDRLVKNVGKEHLLIVLTGLPVQGISANRLQDERIPMGEFNVERAAALINTYLMALYGHERWIDGCYGNQLFLNRILIEQKGMDLQQIQRKTADFLLEFEGVKATYIAREIPLLADTRFNDSFAISNSFHKRSGGDIIFNLLPGWRLVDNRRIPCDAIDEPTPTVPLFIWGGKISSYVIDRPVYATQLAPYICKKLGVAFIGPKNIEVEIQDKQKL